MPAPRAPHPKRVSARLVRWFDEHQRELPWRETRDPYAIWVSEVMLQQTQVATALGYYRRWMERFPTVTALASASEDEVLHAWQGLGYYSRARRLREGARVVLENYRGQLPRGTDQLRAIPGVGRYTAGAISSIAFGERAPIVDGNVTRVLSRLHGLRGDPKKAQFNRELWKRAEELLTDQPPSSVNQGLMELGATVCTPRAPDCARCPLKGDCSAHERGSPERYPGAQKRPRATAVAMAGIVLQRRGKVLLVKLADNAPRWAGMWQFPSVETRPDESGARAAQRAARELTGLRPSSARELCVVKHAVTRFRITLSMYESAAPGGRVRATAGGSATWWKPTELAKLALPAAQRKIAGKLR